ncbi:MAG: toxic anion resistance protein [Negativibacillus massiliensis]|uniref:toxic anion resistance protein n=1 Tax=Negativibacillus massiliensis TaxID=1871035 RepID=UPI00399994E6
MSNTYDPNNSVQPTLTFDPFPETPAPELVQAQQTQAPVKEEPKPVFDESMLTEQERKMVNDFAAQIDLTNSSMILQYGAGAQKKMADFSESALENVRTKDLGEIGQMLSGVVTELKNFDEEEEKGFFGFFKKNTNKLNSMKAKYAKAEANINQIVNGLENHMVTLLKDVAMLDKMYELNKTYFKEISMYILAGQKKLAEVRQTQLAQLIEKAKQTNLPEDAQAANDLAALCDRFEKKLHDLELTRMISIQMAPQLRLVQNNDTLMSEKIQSTIVNTIPLWKSQMVLALGVTHSQQAAQAQREVTDMTNELLRKNAQTLKMATIETAKESERGIVDIETLKATNESLISTLDEVMKIQEEGRQKRRDAEVELGRIEEELKQKLLQIRG